MQQLKYDLNMELLSGSLSTLVVVLLLSAFVKILTTLNILRFGLGLHGAGFGSVIVALTLALTLVVIDPQLEPIGGLDGLVRGNLTQTGTSLEAVFAPFLSKHIQPEIQTRLLKIVNKQQAAVATSGTVQKTAAEEHNPGTTAEMTAEPNLASNLQPQSKFSLLIAAFLLSELKEAFQLGILILIPFLVLDLLVTNILMVLGVTQISQVAVALPLKLLLFFVVDGWTVISEKLLSSYL